MLLAELQDALTVREKLFIGSAFVQSVRRKRVREVPVHHVAARDEAVDHGEEGREGAVVVEQVDSSDPQGEVVLDPLLQVEVVLDDEAQGQVA